MVLSESIDLLVIKYRDSNFTLFENNGLFCKGLFWRFIEEGIKKVQAADPGNNCIAEFLLLQFRSDFQETDKSLEFEKNSPTYGESLSVDNVYLKKDLLLNIGYFANCSTTYLKELELFKGKVFSTPILTPDIGLQVVRFS
jgi:hypothetical protein